MAADPADDQRANYDYAAGPVERPGLVEDLEGLVAGEVRFDAYTRQLYATDASSYEVLPVGVVFPTSTADVAAAVSYCAERSIPVLPRGGGTSLAGQAVNEAVVLDFTRHMDAVLEITPGTRRARAQAGVYLGDLNAALAPHGLKFAPDPAWGDKSALGGAIGNNSTGAHSLVYGKTDAYVESCEAVLADGTVVELGEISLEDLRERADPDGDLLSRIHAEVVRILDEEADEIEARYPDLHRNVSGYDLDRLLDDARAGSVNLARLLCGSEGTLAVVTEAEVALEPLPETKAVALLTYDGLLPALEDVAPILDHGPAALELMDDVLLDLARGSEEFGEVVATLPDGTDSLLLVEFYADSDEDRRQKVAGLIADRVSETDAGADPGPDAVRTEAPRRAVEAMEAYDEAERAALWKLRKSGLAILLSRTTDEKHIAFIEDTAVPAADLPAYVARFQEILAEHGTYASFYAHAGPGVLHIRPLVNTKTANGIASMRAIADAATDLVAEFGGAVSGEHGDGRARTEWNRKLYGDRLWETFRSLKTAFDPDWLLNPGQVCGEVSMTEHLRFAPEGVFDPGFETALNWPNANGFRGMTELCHGCGGCRGPQETTGGVMCPTYRASREEVTSTRGRANLLRAAMTGGLDSGAFDAEFMHEVLDLCIGCKGCKRDCPSGVDMAKLKVEVANEYYRRHGASLRDQLFANIDRLAAVGSTLAPLSNWAPRLPGARWLAERTLGIAADRSLPTFHRRTFRNWFEGHRSAVSDDTIRRALLVPDTLTNYTRPSAGEAAVRVLEAAVVRVGLAEVTDTGRPAYSKGFVNSARKRAEAAVAALAPAVRDGWDVVVVEPSDAEMIVADYADLLSSNAAAEVAENTYSVCEYLDRFDLDPGFDAPDEHLVYHGHCHQKAAGRARHAATVLRRAGYTVDALDSGCCGMAGSFGYEAEHASMSLAVGQILFDQVDASPGDLTVASGASCRAQLATHLGAEPPHPVEKLAEALA